MKRVCSMYAPHFLRAEEMEHQCSVLFSVFGKSGTNLPRSRLSHVITVDEPWTHHYDPKMKYESEAWAP